MLVTTDSSAIDLVDGRLLVYRLDHDGCALEIDAPPSALARVDVGFVYRDDDPEAKQSTLRLIFADPEISWCGEKLQRTPLFFTGPLTAHEDMTKAAATLTEALMESRRVSLGLPEASPPGEGYFPGGPLRPDIEAALGRVQGVLPPPIILNELHASALPAEYVLDIAPLTRSLLVVTTLRIFEIRPDENAVCEAPIDAISGMVQSPDGRQAAIKWIAGVTPLDPGDPRDLARMVSAVGFACVRQREDGAVGPTRPDVCALAREWETLHEYVQLGMTSQEDGRRIGSAILDSLP